MGILETMSVPEAALGILETMSVLLEPLQWLWRGESACRVYNSACRGRESAVVAIGEFFNAASTISEVLISL